MSSYHYYIFLCHITVSTHIMTFYMWLFLLSELTMLIVCKEQTPLSESLKESANVRDYSCFCSNHLSRTRKDFSKNSWTPEDILLLHNNWAAWTIRCSIVSDSISLYQICLVSNCSLFSRLFACNNWPLAVSYSLNPLEDGWFLEQYLYGHLLYSKNIYSRFSSNSEADASE